MVVRVVAEEEGGREEAGESLMRLRAREGPRSKPRLKRRPVSGSSLGWAEKKESS